MRARVDHAEGGIEATGKFWPSTARGWWVLRVPGQRDFAVAHARRRSGRRRVGDGVLHIFGKDRFILEQMDHKIPEQTKGNRGDKPRGARGSACLATMLKLPRFDGQYVVDVLRSIAFTWITRSWVSASKKIRHDPTRRRYLAR